MPTSIVLSIRESTVCVISSPSQCHLIEGESAQFPKLNRGGFPWFVSWGDTTNKKQYRALVFQNQKTPVKMFPHLNYYRAAETNGKWDLTSFLFLFSNFLISLFGKSQVSQEFRIHLTRKKKISTRATQEVQFVNLLLSKSG